MLLRRLVSTGPVGRQMARPRSLFPVPLARRYAAPIVVTSTVSDADASSYLTAATIQPAGNRLHFVKATCTHATAAEIPNAVTGCGVTWAAVTNGSALSVAGTRRVSFFWGQAAAPTAQQITVVFATAHTSCIIEVFEVPGAVAAAPVQATNANAGAATTITGTLAALEYPGNTHLYGMIHVTAEGASPPAVGPWFELTDLQTAAPGGGSQSAWCPGDPTADPTWATSSQSAIVSIENKAAIL